MIQKFSLSEVTLKDEKMQKAQAALLGFIRKIDPDRVLCVFRRTAGIPDHGASPYPGWENSKIGGHALGHYFSALAMAVSFSEDEDLSHRLSYIVSALRECQVALGNGFLSAASPVNLENPEVSFDIEEGKAAGVPIRDSWVPWYAFHKVLSGMIDVYLYTGSEEALTVARGMADWTCARALSWDEKTHSRILHTEYGGMNEALYRLYEITENASYRKCAEVFDDLPLYQRLSLEPDALSGVHANTTIPKYLGAVRRYHVNPSDTDLLRLIRAFFERVVKDQSYITGGIGDMEHFRRDGMQDHSRTQCNAESCCVYNMMKLAQELFFITKDPFYLHYYDRALKNARMGSWHPSGGTTYFNPMGTGFFKVFGNPDPNHNMFWCCTGTGMEDFMKLADGVFYHDKDTLYVCNYSSAALSFKEKDLTVELSVNVNKSEKGLFLVKNNGTGNTVLELRFLVPDWVEGTFSVQGDAIFTESDGFMCAEVTFLPGEEKSFHLSFPMKLRASSLPDAPNVLAFSYGPTVLAAELPLPDDRETIEAGIDVIAPKWKRIGLAGVLSDIEYGRTNRSVLTEEYLTLPAGVDLSAFKHCPEQFFVHTENGFVLKDSITHEIRGLDGPLTFIPYDEITEKRYGIYWYFV